MSYGDFESEPPKFGEHEMARIHSGRYEWVVARALRVVVWQRWWQSEWSARAYLGLSFGTVTPCYTGYVSAQDAAHAINYAVLKIAKGLDAALGSKS